MLMAFKVHDGAILHFFPSTSRPVHVRIGVTSAQDLTCDLRAPLRVYYKEDERMTIHSRNRTPDNSDDACDAQSFLLILETKICYCRFLQLLPIRYRLPHI